LKLSVSGFTRTSSKKILLKFVFREEESQITVFDAVRNKLITVSPGDYWLTTDQRLIRVHTVSGIKILVDVLDVGYNLKANGPYKTFNSDLLLQKKQCDAIERLHSSVLEKKQVTVKDFFC